LNLVKEFIFKSFFKEKQKLIEKLEENNFHLEKSLRGKKFKCIKTIQNETVNLKKSFNKNLNRIIKTISFIEKLKTYDYINDELNAFQEKYELILHSYFSKTTLDVALIGAFNSGKSSLINYLLGKKICPTADKELTSIVTKFYFSPKEIITFNKKEISFKEYQKIANGKVNKQGIIEYGLPHPLLKKVNLYDVPGFEGKEENKNKVLEIIENMDIVFYLIDVNKGATTNSDKENLKDIEKLRKFKGDKYCILTKIDTNITKEEILQVVKEIEEKNIFDEILLSTIKNDKVSLFFKKLNNELKYSLENSKEFDVSLKLEVKKGKLGELFNFSNPYVEIKKSDIIEYKKLKQLKDDIALFIEYLASKKEYQQINTLLKEFSFLNERFIEMLETVRIKQQNYVEEFEKDLKLLINEITIYINDLISLKESIVNIFSENLEVKEASKQERDYFSTPYAKIENYFSQNNKFIVKQIEKLTSNINKKIEEFNLKYSLNLKPYSFDYIKQKLFNYYTIELWDKEKILDGNDYFYDKDKAKERLRELKKELLDRVNSRPAKLIDFISKDIFIKNKKNFTYRRGYLQALDEIEEKKLNNFKTEIEEFKKEIKNAK